MTNATVVDLVALAGAAHGRPVWAHQSEDLNANLLVLVRGEGVAAHINREVDVLVVGVAGEGVVEVDGTSHDIAVGTALIIPKGSSRAIRAEGDRFAYLTCHRRRAGLSP